MVFYKYFCMAILNKVDESIKEERLRICQECDKFFVPTSTCKVCGCFMKLKTTYDKARCPLNKWNEIIIGAG